MAKGNNNLGEYLHPKGGKREPGVSREVAANEEDAGEATVGADTKRNIQEPAKAPAKKTQSDVSPSAEERFYASATPAPVKGMR